jgi:hypothetical protein
LSLRKLGKALSGDELKPGNLPVMIVQEETLNHEGLVVLLERSPAEMRELL